MKSTVGHLGAVTNMVHGFIYFAPEALEEYQTIGLGLDHQYFASRAAPMGAVGPELVIATFFNFNPEIVHRAIPSAWDIAGPDQAQAARFRGADRVLSGVTDALSSDDVAEATSIAEAMVNGVGYEGKPLAGANRAVVAPDNELVRLWQLVTTIREWRGDAHVAVLTAAPVTAVEALVLHAATGVVSTEALQATRQWSTEQWDQGVQSLVKRGLVEADGTFTDAGQSFRQAIESDTDRASQPLVDAVGEAATQRLCALLKPLRNALLASGVYAHGLRTPEKG